MAGLLIVLAGLAIAGGTLLPWVSLSADLGQVAAAAGGGSVAAGLLRGVTIHGSFAHGYESGAGKVVLLLGCVTAVVGLLMLLGADGPWLRAALVCGAGAGIVAGLWYLQHRPSVDLPGVGVTPARGLWLVFAAAGTATVVATLGGSRRVA